MSQIKIISVTALLFWFAYFLYQNKGVVVEYVIRMDAR